MQYTRPRFEPGTPESLVYQLSYLATGDRTRLTATVEIASFNKKKIKRPTSPGFPHQVLVIRKMKRLLLWSLSRVRHPIPTAAIENAVNLRWTVGMGVRKAAKKAYIQSGRTV
jgi:hypothetical protein